MWTVPDADEDADSRQIRSNSGSLDSARSKVHRHTV
jgi:hypothetical protein